MFQCAQNDCWVPVFMLSVLCRWQLCNATMRSCEIVEYCVSDRGREPERLGLLSMGNWQPVPTRWLVPQKTKQYNNKKRHQLDLTQSKMRDEGIERNRNLSSTTLDPRIQPLYQQFADLFVFHFSKAPYSMYFSNGQLKGWGGGTIFHQCYLGST